MGVNFVGAESSGILGSVGHKVNIHKINPATGKERGDLEIKDYLLVFWK